jgi:O-antigen/teichoic acid export membrane protein
VLKRLGGQPGDASRASGQQIANVVVIQLIGRVVNIGLGVAAVALLARSLGPDGFGAWSTALAFVGIFGFLADLGLSRVAIQRMSAEPEREAQWLGALTGTVAVASVISVVVTLAAIPLLSNESDVRLITAILALTLLPAAPGALLTVFDSRVRAEIRIGVMTLNSIAWLAAIVVLDLEGVDIVAFAVAFVILAFVMAGVHWGVTRRFARIALREGRRLWRPLLRVALPLGIAGVLVTIYYRVDSVLIFNIKGPEEAGVYGAAYRFLDPLHFLPTSVMAAAFPVMSAFHGRDTARVRRLIQRGIDYMVIAALAALGLAIALADPIVDTLLGPGYERTAGLLPILMLAFVFISLGYLSGYLAPIVGMQWRLAVFAAIGVVVNIGLNLALIPPYGAFGAAWATVATEAAVNFLALLVAFRALDFRPALSAPLRAVLAAAAMTGVAALLAPLGFVVALLVAVPVYVVALVLLGAIAPDEIRDLLLRRREPASD